MTLPLPPLPPPPECTHSDDEAVHAEVEQWVVGWARRLLDSCHPLPDDGRLARPGRATATLGERWDEVRASRPARFVGCVLASHSMIRNTIYGLNDEANPRR